MARHLSGVFSRGSLAPAAAAPTVRLLNTEHKVVGSAAVLELGTSTLRLSASRPPELGTQLFVAITLPGRYIEFELPGVVDWELDNHFGVSLRHLTARQAYGLALARELLRTAAPGAAATQRRAARR